MRAPLIGGSFGAGSQSRSRFCLFLFALSCSWLCAGSASAADTTEPFDKGAVDAELYLGLTDAGMEGSRAATNMVLGYGLTERFSLMVGASFEQALRENVQSGHVQFGSIFNVIDTAHVDLDLLFCGHAGDDGFASWQVVPGFELNFDSQPGQEGVGLYFLSGLAMGSHPEVIDSPHRILLAWELPLALGAYATVAQGHQLLLEADMGVMLESAPVQRFNFGGVSAGYNLVLTSWLELINQLRVDVPQADESVSYSATVGVIMTL